MSILVWSLTSMHMYVPAMSILFGGSHLHDAHTELPAMSILIWSIISMVHTRIYLHSRFKPFSLQHTHPC